MKRFIVISIIALFVLLCFTSCSLFSTRGNVQYSNNSRTQSDSTDSNAIQTNESDTGSSDTGTPSEDTTDDDSTEFNQQDAESEELFSFTLLENDTYSLKAKDAYSLPSTFEIPDTYKNKPVTTIEENAFSGKQTKRVRIYSITLPNSITSIEDGAFGWCSNLQIVKYKGTASQWASIDGLKNITLANDGTSIFSVREVFINNTTVDEIELKDIETIKPYAFRGFKWLKKATIGDGVIEIGSNAFYACVGLEDVSLPNSITKIEDYAFKNCSNLVNLNIPNKLTTLEKEVFQGCSSLAMIFIPDSIQTIGESAFYNCTNLSDLIISDSVQSIGDYAFYNCSSLVDLTIKKATEIGNSAFAGCSALETLSISDTVTVLGDACFRDCASLTNINVDDNNPNYKSINGNLYNKNGTTIIRYAAGKSDTHFTVSKDVKRISAYAFSASKNLESVSLGLIRDGYSVTTIGEGAFSNCSLLETITIGGYLSGIGSRAFYNCSNLKGIYYEYPTSSWVQISKGQDWQNGVSSDCIIHCYGGTIKVS